MIDWRSLKAKAQALADTAAERTREVVAEAKEKSIEVWNSDEAVQLRERAKESVEKTKVWTKEHSQALTEYAQQFASETGDKVADAWNSDGMVKFRGSSQKALKVVSGMQAIEDRRKSIQTREEADKLKADIEKTNEDIREDLNETLETFGKYRLEALSATVGKFLHCLEVMKQKSKVKEYEFLTEIDIQAEEVKEMEAIDMKASEALRTLAVGGGFAAIGIAGTPVAVTFAVTHLCAASTGAAISSLSGAAASNAVLAWLGGGTIASGGGGIAAGTVVLGTITATATIGLAVVAVGTLASRFYSKKNTEAEAYLADVKIWAEQMQAGWTVIGGIKRKITELYDITDKLKTKSEGLLQRLESIAGEFDTNNNDHVKLFQQCAILAKSMSELAQTPILDEDGNLSDQVGLVAGKTEKILNSEL